MQLVVAAHADRPAFESARRRAAQAAVPGLGPDAARASTARVSRTSSSFAAVATTTSATTGSAWGFVTGGSGFVTGAFVTAWAGFVTGFVTPRRIRCRHRALQTFTGRPVPFRAGIGPPHPGHVIPEPARARRVRTDRSA